MGRSLGIAALALPTLLLGAGLFWFLAGSADPGGAVGPGAVGEAEAPEPGQVAPPVPLQDAGARQEAQAARREPPAEVGFQVSVLDGEGAPVHGAWVAVSDAGWREAAWFEEPPYAGTDTGRDGIARFGVLEDEWREVLVLAPNHPAQRAEREVERKRLEVRLPGPLSLAGWVRVDGAAPGAPLSMRLTGFRDDSVTWCPAARALLSQRELGESRMNVRVSKEGRLRIFGLPAGERVTLRTPDHLRLLRGAEPGRPHLLDLVTIDAGIRVELGSLPEITGRPVAPPGLAPGQGGMPGTLTARYRLLRENGEVRGGDVRCALGEVFRIPFLETDLVGLELDLEADWGGEVLASRELHERLDASLDLGDIPLAAVDRALAVLVQDVQGRPLPGARVRASQRVSPSADEQGRTRIELRSSDTELIAGAFGHGLTRVLLPEPLPDILVVTLAPTNRLRLTVTTPDGQPPAGLLVSIRAPYDAQGPEYFQEFAHVRGIPPGAGSWDGTSQTHHYDLDPSGVFELSFLPPDIPLGLGLLDRQHNEILNEEFQLGPEEVLELHRTLPRGPRSIAGRVLDREGRPVPGAVVEMGGWLSEVVADEEGAFRLDHVYAAEPTLTIRAHGFALARIAGESLYGQSVFPLEPGRTVWVEVLDARGERVGAQVVIELPDGGTVGGHGRSKGLYEVQSLPFTVVNARATAGGRTVEMAVGSNETDVRLHLPDR